MEQQILQLDREVERLQGLSLEDSTKKSYESHRKSYISFCEQFGFPPTPISPQQAARYVAFLSHRLAPVSIPKYLNIIRIMHLQTGLPDPEILLMFEVKTALVGFSKEKGSPPHRMKPITPNILLAIRQLLHFNKTEDVSFWATCLTVFFGFLRKSNLLAPSIKGFDPNKHLSRTCIRVTEWGYILALPWTKTIQRRERILEIPLVAVPGHPLCPVRALQQLLSFTLDASPLSPVFLRRDKGKLTPVLYGWFSDKLKSLLQVCLPDNEGYGTHSLRRGGATWALQCGVPTEVIRIMGDWHSDAYKAYLEVSISQKLVYMHQINSDLPSLS